MRIQSLQNYHPFTANTVMARTTAPINSGLISEFVYNEDQPAVSQLLVLLLQQIGKQSRWMLWLNPQQKLSRLWLQQSNLPIDKVIQLRQIDSHSVVETMEKALLTGNYSVVLGWLPDLSDSDRSRLRLAAQSGNTYGFIMSPQYDTKSKIGEFSTLKIHSYLYH